MKEQYAIPQSTIDQIIELYNQVEELEWGNKEYGTALPKLLGMIGSLKMIIEKDLQEIFTRSLLRQQNEIGHD